MFGLTRGSSRVLGLGALGLVGSLAFGAPAALAVHENVTFPAAIHAGSCEAPGEVVLELDNLVRLPAGSADEGERAGAPMAQVVHGSPEDAAIDLGVADLFAAEHVLAVFNAAGDTIVACGPIGAYTYAEGDDLAIGLREQGDSNFSGLALFTGNDADGLDVEVYLVSSATPPPMDASCDPSGVIPLPRG